LRIKSDSRRSRDFFGVSSTNSNKLQSKNTHNTQNTVRILMK
jgi:hypothetical protein